jgi:hypothetical protein
VDVGWKLREVWRGFTPSLTYVEGSEFSGNREARKEGRKEGLVG